MSLLALPWQGFSPIPLPNETKEVYLDRMIQEPPLIWRPTHRDPVRDAEKARTFFGTYYDQYQAQAQPMNVGNDMNVNGVGGRRRRKSYRRKSHRRKTHRRKSHRRN
jgi:hypothetical protein